MKANELMIGDWVYAIIDFYPTRKEAIKIDYISLQVGYRKFAKKSIEPIPLTEEILKANGFILKGKTSVEDNDMYYCVYVDADNKAYEIHYRTCDGQLRIFLKNYLFGITYVHEMQHAFRLFGLHELADNFKIK